MIRRFLRWLFELPDALPPAPEPKSRTSLFSTDADGLEPMDREVLRATINERYFSPSVLQAIRVVSAAPVATDSAETRTSVTFGMDDGEGTPSLKAAFSLGRLGVPEVQAAWYGSQSFIGYQMCAIMAQHWLVQKACAVPARDAIRKGYTITRTDGQELPPEIVTRIEAADKRYRLKRNLVEYVKFGRVFGVRVAMCKVESEDEDYLVKPFNLDSVKPGSYRGIVQIDPYWVVPELTSASASDPSSIDFYEPTYWIVNSKRVHKSHLVIMRGPEVADILKPAYLFGGLSIPQLIYERVYAAERSANEAPMLMTSKRSTFLYTDTENAIANEGKFVQRIDWWSRMRDNFGVKVLDKDGDKAEQFDTALSDLDVNIMTQYQLVAAVANVPATKLLGTTPKGFNSTGEYEEANYHEELESIQANDMQPLMDRHYACLLRSEIAPAYADMKDATLVPSWKSLDSLTAEEQATVNKTKADTDLVLVQAGALDGTDIRQRLAQDHASGYAGIALTEELTDDDGDETTGAL